MKRDFWTMDYSDGSTPCFICGAVGGVERHHIFGGALRSKSDKYGLVVPLCHNCHNEPPNGVHHNREKMDMLHRWAERKMINEHGWSKERFMKEFYKNYLEDDEL